jgi:hypothetical protein
MELDVDHPVDDIGWFGRAPEVVGGQDALLELPTWSGGRRIHADIPDR